MDKRRRRWRRARAASHHRDRLSRRPLLDWDHLLEPVAGWLEDGTPDGVVLLDLRDGRGGDFVLPSKGWAWRLFEDVVAKRWERVGRAAPPSLVEKVWSLSRGLTYAGYGAACVLPDADVGLVARLPLPDAPDDQALAAIREARLLVELARLRPPFETARLLGLALLPFGVAHVQQTAGGHYLGDEAGRARFPDTPELIGAAAAACHRLPTAPFAFLGGPVTRRDHAQARIEETLPVDTAPELDDARAWAESHLPPATPARLLHGDLLPQNLLRDELTSDAVTLIDWGEAQLGDPAYDLAIVTQSGKRTLGPPDGRRRLLDAYDARARDPVTPEQLRLHELCLLAGFYRAEQERFGPNSEAAGQALRRVANRLRRRLVD